MEEKTIVYEIPESVLETHRICKESLREGMKATKWEVTYDATGQKVSIEVPDTANRILCCQMYKDLFNHVPLTGKLYLGVIKDEGEANGTNT